MRLTAQQRRMLEQALADAFRSKDELARLVRHGLDRNLASITTTDNLTNIIFYLVEWADQHNEVGPLLDEALTENPGNTHLKEVAAAIRSAALDRTAVSHIHPAILSNPAAPEKAGGQSILRQYSGILAGAFIGFLVGVLGNLVAAWIQQDVLHNIFTPLGITIVLILTLAGIMLGAWLQLPRTSLEIHAKTYWVFTGLVVAILVLAGSVVVIWMPKPQAPPTMYLVVDATAKIQPIFDQVRSAVQLSTSSLRANSRIGLRVYGGDISGSDGCEDTKQLLAPGVYQNVGSRLDSILAEISPNGQSSLTGAVLDALYTDLSREDQPIKLIVITAGINPLCDPPAGGILESRAKDIKSDLELVIVSIGEVDPHDDQVLTSYATAFHGNHVHIATAQNLPLIVKTISNYGYGYGYDYVFGGISPTPTP